MSAISPAEIQSNKQESPAALRTSPVAAQLASHWLLPSASSVSPAELQLIKQASPAAFRTSPPKAQFGKQKVSCELRSCLAVLLTYWSFDDTL